MHLIVYFLLLVTAMGTMRIRSTAVTSPPMSRRIFHIFHHILSVSCLAFLRKWSDCSFRWMAACSMFSSFSWLTSSCWMFSFMVDLTMSTFSCTAKILSELAGLLYLRYHSTKARHAMSKDYNNKYEYIWYMNKSMSHATYFWKT